MDARKVIAVDKREPIELIGEIKTIFLELAELKAIMASAKTNHSFPAAICDISHDDTLNDKAISKLKELAADRLFVLWLLKLGRDGAYALMPASVSLGVCFYVMNQTVLAKECLYLALAIMLALFFLDKHIIENRVHSFFFPLPSDICPTRTWQALNKRYESLQQCCEAWLALDSRLKNNHFVVVNQDTCDTQPYLQECWAERLLPDADMTKRLEAEVAYRAVVSVTNSTNRLMQY